MFIRNGQALGSVLHSAAPKADADKPKPAKKTAAKKAAVKKVDPAPEPVKDEEASDGGDVGDI